MDKLLISYQRPSQNLEQAISTKLKTADEKKIHRRVSVWLIIFVIGLTLFVPALIMLKTDLDDTGFFSFFSLLFSDSSATLAHAREFFVTLAESLPILALAIALGLFSILTLSIISLGALFHFAKGRKVSVI